MNAQGIGSPGCVEGELEVTRAWEERMHQIEQIKAELDAKRYSKSKLIELCAMSLMAGEALAADLKQARERSRAASACDHGVAAVVHAVASSVAEGWDPADLIARALEELQPDHPTLLNLRAITLQAAVAARRTVAKKAASSRHNNGDSAKSKDFVRTCWSQWRRDGGHYVSAIAFARDMLDKQLPGVTSEVVVCRWVRAWDKTEQTAPCKQGAHRARTDLSP